MGVSEWIGSAIDFLMRKSPEPVTEACRKGYEVSRSAAVNLDGTVRTKAREVHLYLSDDQAREMISRIVKNTSKNGALQLARYFGGPVVDVVLRSSALDIKDDSLKKRIDELEKRIGKLESKPISKL